MKKIYKISLCIALCFAIVNGSFAQKKKTVVENEESVCSYSRNSISLLYTSYSDNLDSYVSSGLSGATIDEKFDVNYIATRAIPISGKRDSGCDSILDERVNEVNVGRDIIAYWYNRDPNTGVMDVSIMKERSLYNASAQDKMNAAASQVNNIASMGAAMIPNSYIVVFDVKSISQSTSGDGYYASGNAYVYKIEFSMDQYKSSGKWILRENDNADKRAEKMKMFNELKIPMARVLKMTVSGSGNTYAEAVTDMFSEGNLNKMEKKIDGWKVKTSVYDVKPIIAKVGKKEGIKNGDRYRAFSFQENKEGQLVMVKKGYVRATSVVDNRTDKSDSTTMNSLKESALGGLFSKKDKDAAKETKSSKQNSYLDSIKASQFYQISGVPLKAGVMLQQDKDARVGISLGAKFGGLSIADVRVDYLAFIHNSGVSHYALLDLGYDFVYQLNYGNKAKGSMVNAAIGYGCGLPISKAFELQPFLLVGADMSLGSATNSYSRNHSMAYFGDLGVRFSIMPAYHVQIFAQADYSLVFKEDTYYANATHSFLGYVDKYYRDNYIGYIGTGHFGLGGLGISVGVRVLF